MKKLIYITLALGFPMMATAQESMDALQMSQTELRGTARYQSMAGAMGALGGDITTLNHNPGGIGVYRSSDVNISFDIDGTQATVPGATNFSKETKFNVSSAGYVGTFDLNNDVMPYINLGLSYNRTKDFNRRYRGNVNTLQSSISNYIAAHTGNFTGDEMTTDNSQSPYFNTYAPWMSILAYNSYIINDNNGWQGLWGNGTSGYGEFEVVQNGHADEFNITIGGNINDVVYWGIGGSVTDFRYNNYIYYGEHLNNAYVADYETDQIVNGVADYGFENILRTTGTGFNGKIGVIVKPINQLRLGVAFHTPTYYNMTDEYKTNAAFEMMPNQGKSYYGNNETGTKGYYDYAYYTLKTPWRFIGSVALVAGSQGLVSVDYEYTANTSMRVGEEDNFNYDYPETTRNIQDNLCGTHTLRIGGEFRVTPQLSVRAGYAYQTSPVIKEIEDSQWNVTTTSSCTTYEFDNSMQNITCGFGYKSRSGFYADMAYVYTKRESTFNAFSPIAYQEGPTRIVEPGVNAKVTDDNHRLAFTLGYRF